MKKYVSLTFAIIVLLGYATISKAGGEAVVSGVLVSRINNMGAPGLTVSLVHPNLGRSMPAISDPYGRYMFYGIPIMSTPYILRFIGDIR